MRLFHESTDYTLEAGDYSGDDFTVTLTDSEYLYFGYRKPIRELYAHFTTVNSNAATLSVEYYNGTTYTAVTTLNDRTKSFTRNGFISWEKSDDEEEATVETLEMYWYRISVSVSTSEMVIRGFNLLFSDDLSVREEEAHLLSTDYYPASETSFVNYHQASRNELIQRLRNKGYGVKNSSGVYNDLLIFDLHERKQLETASKYLVLSKIYFNLSDAPEDKYHEKHVNYKRMSDDAFHVFYISIDSNDDGKESTTEQAGFTSGLIVSV